MKIFDLIPGWIYALVVGILGLACGLLYVQRVQAEKDLLSYKTQVAQNTQAAEAAMREAERKMQDEADRIARDAESRQKALSDRVVSSQRVVAGLRDEIDRLNARPAPENPELAACFAEARVARELLGSCSEEYRGVAQEADGLRDQVTGLQDFVKSIQGQ